MFHQVMVRPNNCDALRGFGGGATGGNLNQNSIEFRMVVHIFGGMWSPSCTNVALQKPALNE